MLLLFLRLVPLGPLLWRYYPEGSLGWLESRMRALVCPFISAGRY
jgi:hypothetical protein